MTRMWCGCVYILLLNLVSGFLVEETPGNEEWRRYPYRDTSLTWEQRVDDLVSRLTLEEIQVQLARGGTGDVGSPAPAIPRLGVGPYAWDSECLHGAAREEGNATSFPQSIGLAATFSPAIVERMAAATGQEVRGKHNDFVKKGIFQTHAGASCFSPVINVETYGEDPFMSGKLSQSYVKGLHGYDSRYIQASSGCKHFDAYSGPENIPVTSISFNAQVSERDWKMTYLPAFKACVAAGTYSIMCSYNRINGVPACANKKLLTDILRTEWGFKGYVISDQGAIEFIQEAHNYTSSPLDTAVAALSAGCNLELSNNLLKPDYMYIVDAVHQGKLTEDLVRERVKPLFYTRMRLGEFDPPDNNPFAQLDSSVAESPEHQALALEAAMKSFVLLKNRNNILPLQTTSYSKVAIVGPMANNTNQLSGDYSAVTDPSYFKNPLEGLKELFPNAVYENVCEDGNKCKQYRPDLVSQAVSQADLVFVVLGTGCDVEMEGNDRPDLELPGHQKDLLLDVLQNSGSAPVVLLLFSAGPLNISTFDENDRVAAIMECFLPAQATGDAVRNILTNTGQFGSPSGRLPITWPYYANQVPPMVNYSMEGRTYRYIKSDPLYPFGYGLSYTQFQYASLVCPASVQANQSLDISFQVSNVGTVDSDEVVQCYISWADPTLPVPVRQLVYFDRVHIKSAQMVTVQAFIPGDLMAYWDNGSWNIKSGTMNLYCGGQQPFQKKSSPSNVLSAQFNITNTLSY